MSWGSLTYKLAESTNCRLQTIVFRVRKQWNYCCHVVICMVKLWFAAVYSLHFVLTV